MAKTKTDIAAEDQVAQRLITGLAKIGIAMKSKAWRSAPGENLTPTQGQILVLLRDRGGPPRDQRERDQREDEEGGSAGVKSAHRVLEGSIPSRAGGVRRRPRIP